MRANLSFEIKDFRDTFNEPWIDAARLKNLVLRHAMAKRLGNNKQPVWGRYAQGGAQHIHVIAKSQAFDLYLVYTIKSRVEGAHPLLQAFGESPADCHGLADRFHRGRQDLLCAGKFFKSKARNLGNNIVDRRLERGWGSAAGNIIGDFI